MPILNYTTKIDVRRTAGEISEILADAGAQSVNIQYENRIPAALTFSIELQGRLVNFRLPSKWQGVHNLLKEDQKVQRAFKTEEQARRVAWRIVKDWVEAQLAIIQSGTAELAEVFLPYAVHPETGRTLFEEFKTGHLLTSGQDDVIDGEVREE
jgi:hypothetical protein